MFYARAILIGLGGIVIGVAAAAWFLQPVTTPAQDAILNQYLYTYCVGPPPDASSDRKMFAAGEAAALSRIIIAAGLGEIGLAEYAKCKATVFIRGTAPLDAWARPHPPRKRMPPPNLSKP
jgi:hypothetical protein